MFVVEIGGSINTTYYYPGCWRCFRRRTSCLYHVYGFRGGIQFWSCWWCIPPSQHILLLGNPPEAPLPFPLPTLPGKMPSEETSSLRQKFGDQTLPSLAKWKFSISRPNPHLTSWIPQNNGNHYGYSCWHPLWNPTNLCLTVFKGTPDQHQLADLAFRR